MLMAACKQCRFVIIPDMLKNAPMFKRIDPKMKVRPFLLCCLIFILPYHVCKLPGIIMRVG